MINYPHGYYTVGDAIFANKALALLESTKSNIPVKWIFNDEVFSKFNWTIRPPGTLPYWYQQRAQQLRDTYDYITIWFSGGSDSWTVLNSFLSNGIHVDEVYTRWTRSERKFKDADPTDTDSSNTGSEYEYAVAPVLEYIKKNFPKTTITVDDPSDELFTKDVPLDKLLFGNTGYQTFSGFTKLNRKTAGELAASNKNKKIANVIGAGKIEYKIQNGNFYSFFFDGHGRVDQDYKNIEFFFSTPDLPELSILQSHCLKDFIKSVSINGVISTAIVTTTGKKIEINNRSIYDRRNYALACYPNWNINTFQAEKHLGSIIHKDDLKAKEFNPNLFNKWWTEVVSFVKDIDPTYYKLHPTIKKLVVGYTLIPSNYYLIESNTNLKDT
jgi:hypothetical protein